MAVHTTAAPAVLSFWFDEVGHDGCFAKNDALDASIRQRFDTLREEVLASHAEGWRDTPEHLLAALILLDQFSRNLYRGSWRAFEADPLALDLAMLALDRGWTDTASREHRQFLLMPLMHSEDSAVQERSVAEFTELGDAYTLDFARRHRDLIIRFGRFPGRNQALGRVSTVEEREALRNGAAF